MVAPEQAVPAALRNTRQGQTEQRALVEFERLGEGAFSKIEEGALGICYVRKVDDIDRVVDRVQNALSWERGVDFDPQGLMLHRDQRYRIAKALWIEIPRYPRVAADLIAGRMAGRLEFEPDRQLA